MCMIFFFLLVPFDLSPSVHIRTLVRSILFSTKLLSEKTQSETATTDENVRGEKTGRGGNSHLTAHVRIGRQLPFHHGPHVLFCLLQHRHQSLHRRFLVKVKSWKGLINRSGQHTVSNKQDRVDRKADEGDNRRRPTGASPAAKGEVTDSLKTAGKRNKKASRSERETSEYLRTAGQGNKHTQLSKSGDRQNLST